MQLLLSLRYPSTWQPSRVGRYDLCKSRVLLNQRAISNSTRWVACGDVLDHDCSVSAWAWYSQSLIRRPLVTKTVSAASILGTADVIRLGSDACLCGVSLYVYTDRNTKTTNAECSATSRRMLRCHGTIHAARRSCPRGTFTHGSIGGYHSPLFLRYALVHAPWVHVWFQWLDKLYGTAITPRSVLLKTLTDQV